LVFQWITIEALYFVGQLFSPHVITSNSSIVNIKLNKYTATQEIWPIKDHVLSYILLQLSVNLNHAVLALGTWNLSSFGLP